MSNYRINSVNTLSTYFAPKGAGLTAGATNIRQAGTDLNALLMGRDNRAGNAVTAISSTGYRVGGKPFNVPSKGTREERTELFKNGRKYIGKMLSVQYFGLTSDGVPRFPKSLREGESSIREE